jgi:hypothetical protein
VILTRLSQFAPKIHFIRITQYRLYRRVEFHEDSVIQILQAYRVGRNSSVDIPTSYGLDGPGIESRWGRDFPHPSRPALGPTQPPVQWESGYSPGVKRLGLGAKHPHPSSAEIKERAELYLYSSSGPSWPVLGSSLLLQACRF